MQQESLVIVSGSRKEMKKAAHYLYNTIGALGVCKASIWEEKHYKDNEPLLPSSQPVIFVGETDTSKLLLDSISWSYDNLNMRYGWIGKRAVVYVQRENLSIDDYYKFKSMFQSQKKSIKDGSLLDKAKRLEKRLTMANTKIKLVGLFVPFAWYAAKYSLLKGYIDSKKIIKQQYPYVINEFIDKSLGDFLGNS